MIGIFDSGFGGLTTLKELLKIIPERDFLFLGDQARSPYGIHGQERVTEYTEQGVEFLFTKGAKIVLLACNTASADALRNLQAKYGSQKKVLGALIPAMEEALQKTRYGRVGLIATRSTVETGNYEKELQKLWKTHYKPTEKKALTKPILTSVSAPLLVPLVEEGWIKKPETRSILKKYLISLKHANVDTLILGCTHYPLLQKEFERKMGKNCVIINSGASQAKAFAEYLKNHPKISSSLSQSSSSSSPLQRGARGDLQFFTTDCPEKFQKLGEIFLGKKMKKVENVKL